MRASRTQQGQGWSQGGAVPAVEGTGRLAWWSYDCPELACKHIGHLPGEQRQLGTETGLDV
jgi:hypothetical protein